MTEMLSTVLSFVAAYPSIFLAHCLNQSIICYHANSLLTTTRLTRYLTRKLS